MIFERGMLFNRNADCGYGNSHRFNKEQQRALFLKGLSRGAALISPDELSYFRSGCELDSQEEDNIYHGFSGFVTSTVLLAEHRLFGTYHGLNFIKEASLQIAISTIHVVNELIKILFSTIELGLLLLFMTFTLGSNLMTLGSDLMTFALGSSPDIHKPSPDVLKMTMWSIQRMLYNVVKTCVAVALLVTGIIGALLTRPISTLFNPVVNSTDNADISEEQVKTSMEEIGCDDYARVKNSIFWLRDSKGTKRGNGSRLERVVGSLVDIIDEAAILTNTELTYDCNCRNHWYGS